MTHPSVQGNAKNITEIYNNRHKQRLENVTVNKWFMVILQPEEKAPLWKWTVSWLAAKLCANIGELGKFVKLLWSA